ncbi:hypothetical protein [Streptomyces zagrosensis]|uniref:Uncharacterized protein n=1 Tax=Streptomyces zagrosensis TaxID=1042984 RepID=A0A7W9UXT8_9ACTN|nr:hypothetical protein [Streptomyces zagrosensis]MBB5934666.1 hypothetical protein [Streptomyces zagrosensis]
MPNQVWVHLLVWHPADPSNPLDVSQSWPRVLQVVKDGAIGPPGVTLQPGEAIPYAVGRVATALGLQSPEPPRLLAVDQQPAEHGLLEQVAMVFDGGWLAVDPPPRGNCGRSHTVWTPMHEVGRVALVHAFRGLRAGGCTSTVLWRGDMPTGRGGRTRPHPRSAPSPGWGLGPGPGQV